MKRLIKSELFKGENFADKYYESFVNPDLRDFEILSKINNSFRGILLEDGTLYIWDYLLSHVSARSLFKIPNGIHLIIDPTNLEIFTNDFTKEQLSNAFKNTTSLYNWIDRDFPITFYGNNKFEEFKTIQDIINYKKKFKLW